MSVNCKQQIETCGEISEIAKKIIIKEKVSSFQNEASQIFDETHA